MTTHFRHSTNSTSHTKVCEINHNHNETEINQELNHQQTTERNHTTNNQRNQESRTNHCEANHNENEQTTAHERVQKTTRQINLTGNNRNQEINHNHDEKELTEEHAQNRTRTATHTTPKTQNLNTREINHEHNTEVASNKETQEHHRSNVTVTPNRNRTTHTQNVQHTSTRTIRPAVNHEATPTTEKETRTLTSNEIHHNIEQRTEGNQIAETFATLHQDLQKGITRLGFTIPTPIQQQAIPFVLQGRDILATSMTGSGKTAAFLLPIMNRIISDRENEKKTTGRVTAKTRALILTPTRELAAQICQHFNDLAQCTNLSCAAVFGGVSMLPQENAFRNCVDIMVATPGRLLDHMTRPYAKLPHLEYLVLDEADRMLDMGFLPDIRRVMNVLPKRQRQTLLFSATLPAPIVILAKDMLNKPATVDVERPQITATGIEHKAFKVSDNLKQELLLNIIDQHQIRSAIIFTRTKHRAKRLAQFLDRQNVATDCIHGNRSQLQRTKALEDFRNGKVRVLVATDIASRGIDVEAVSHVINFDVPHVVEDYVHRAGRTARANLTGYSYTLVSSNEMHDFCQIERTIKTRIEQVVLENFNYTAKPTEALEIPLAQRIAEIRAHKSACRARSAAKQQRRNEPIQHAPRIEETRNRSNATPRPATHQANPDRNERTITRTSRPTTETRQLNANNDRRPENNQRTETTHRTETTRRPATNNRTETNRRPENNRQQETRRTENPNQTEARRTNDKRNLPDIF